MEYSMELNQRERQQSIRPEKHCSEIFITDVDVLRGVMKETVQRLRLTT